MICDSSLINLSSSIIVSCCTEQLKGEGTGGMPEFIASLPEDDVMWGAFKVVGCDDRGNLVSRRPKYIFVKWMPASGVPGMKKAKTAGHKGDLKKIINSHVDIEVTN